MLELLAEFKPSASTTKKNRKNEFISKAENTSQ